MTNHNSSSGYKPVFGSRQRNESGVALIVAIVGLLIVTAVAAGMILVSTSETRVDSNYRDQQVALFAAKAGLEEARDRMLAGNANPITLPTVLPSASGSIADYIVQTGIAPWTNGSLVNGVSTYDQEFANEINGTSTLPGSASYTSYTTVSNYSGPTANPLAYQWVRINLKTDRSAYTNGTPYYVDGNSANANKQVCWDQANLHEVVISAANCQAASTNYQPVYEITSFAVTRNGTRRIVQDEVAALNFNLNLDAAVTIPGTVASFTGGSSSQYAINGTSTQGTAPAVPGCTPSGSGPAVAVSSQGNANVVQGGISRDGNYTGTSCTLSTSGQACVGTATLPSSMSTPAALEQTLQQIKQNASPCLGCSQPAGSNTTYSFSQITSAVPGGWSNSSDDPQIIYVNGNLDISGNNVGSGILVVTGTMTYSGSSGWNGIVLVVGQGTTQYNTNFDANGTASFNGEMFVATIEDANGNILPTFGDADFNINGGGHGGVNYDNCWVNASQAPVTYMMLSSKDISY